MPEDNSLSQRQLEVLELVSKGCSNSDIARMLYLSPNTVKTHLSNILRILDLSNRTEASVWYEQHCSEELQHQALCLTVRADEAVTEQRNLRAELADLLGRRDLIQICENDTACLYTVEIRKTESDALVVALLYQESAQSQQMLWSKTLQCPVEAPATCYLAAQAGNTLVSHYASAVLAARSVVTGLAPLFLVEHKLRHRSGQHLTEAYETLSQLHHRYPDLPVVHSYRAIVVYVLLLEGFVPATADYLGMLTESAQYACNMAPESALSQQAFALHCMLNKRYALALKHIRRAVDINPLLEPALFLKGQVLALNGHYQQALASYDEYLALYPEGEFSGRCYAGMSLVYYLSGDYAEAKELAHQAMLYNQTVQAGLCLVLISIAVREQDQRQLASLLKELDTITGGDQNRINNVVTFVAAVIPAESMQSFFADLVAAGVKVVAIPRSPA
ncbi:MAG: LuxR C-terminal-related transcriptional regulator [Alcanivorax sp.]|nr:LuxR C-terminal-related transcriptional regulator [Alcanivorax sp.]